MVNGENNIQQARSVTLANVKRCVGEGDPLVAICCDSGRSFRKDLSADYKANREKQPAAAYEQLEKTKERLRADGYLLWSSEGFEADDLLATAADRAVAAGHDVRVASADKDLLQLIGPHVDCLRTHTWTVVGVKEFTDKYKIKPVQFTDWLALKGDSSDNIPGCNGCGDKWASDLLLRFDTLPKLYAALDAGKADLPKKLTENLIACREKVELSRKLVELNYEVPIDFAEIYKERKVSSLTQNTPLPPTDGDPTDEAKTEPVSDASDSGNSESSVEPVTTRERESSTGASVALVPAVEYERQLEPRSLRAAVWLGQHLYDSRLYQRFPTPEAITAVIIRGREIGLGATTALDVFHVIDGKPVPYAWFIISLAMNWRECEYLYCVEQSDKSATWETKHRRNPKPQTCTFTYAQAETAQLPKTGARGPNAWIKSPEDMLVKTAGVKLARRVYPAATLGLYCLEELGHDVET